jgi:hypothetical protein
MLHPMCRGATERRLQALHSVSVEQIRFLVPAAYLGLAKVNALSQNLILSLRYLFLCLRVAIYRVRMLDNTERRALPHSYRGCLAA